LIQRIIDDTISNNAAKTVFDVLWNDAGRAEVDAIIDAQGLTQMRDSSELESIVAEIVANHPDQAAQLSAGKDKLMGFFVGQVMKATQGKANPKQINELLRKALKI
jgi:aspartyl-tRNA(Asn)/glutamyl-tRNA(Gln) amidotransferase subunit B